MIDVNAILKDLAGLKPDWDSYGGDPPTPEALEGLKEFLDYFSIVPTNNGGIGIESHGEYWDLSLDISSTGIVSTVYFERRDRAWGGR